MQNIWQVTSIKNLNKLIDNCSNKFMIIGVVLKNNDQNEKKAIKNFYKSIHKIYPNITFIYYELDESELGKGISILKNSKEEYPYLYHIYDKDKIIVNVSNVNEETLIESFNIVKKYYDDDKKNNYDVLCNNNSRVLSNNNNPSVLLNNNPSVLSNNNPSVLSNNNPSVLSNNNNSRVLSNNNPNLLSNNNNPNLLSNNTPNQPEEDKIKLEKLKKLSNKLSLEMLEDIKMRKKNNKN